MLVIDPEFKAMIPPLSPEERDRLRDEIIVAGGATVPIVTWGTIIVDGHNRFEICSELGLAFTFERREFSDRSAAKAWMIEHQIARRNLSPDQLLMVRTMAGMPPGNETARRIEIARALLAHPDKAAKVRSGAWSLALAYGSTPKARAQRAARQRERPISPERPVVPEGMRVEKLSTLVDQDGAIVKEWVKTGLDAAPPATLIPEGHHVRRQATMLDREGNALITWVSTETKAAEKEASFWAACERNAQSYRGLAGVSEAPTRSLGDLITLYPLGDPHIGMLAWAPEAGEHFDTKIACDQLLETVVQLVAAAPASERAIITNLGDFMHAQDDTALTPGHGNRLDVDGRFSKVLDAGHTLLRGIVDAALTKHRHVSIRNLPGNHDPRVATELMFWLRAVYEKDPRVNVADAYAAHQYDRFGTCLFGWHHGDRTPTGELPAIMASDQAEAWGQTTERVWHVGHVHHLTRKETPGCVVETHRTMAAGDSWHAGRYRAARSLSAISYHREHGETARATVHLSQVRHAGRR